MKNYLPIIFVMLLGLLYSCDTEVSQPATNEVLEWPSSTNTAKPWTRWWWHGSSVTKAGITAELEAYKEAGLGGLELTPIYGVKGDEDNFLTYLSPEWTKMLEYTLEEADRLGLGIDMATGTGWPFGGPWVDQETACKYVAHKKYTIQQGEKLSEKIEFIQKPLFRTVNTPGLKITDLSLPISGNENLQKLALDQVRFEQALPLLSLVAYSENKEAIHLTDRVKDGILDWTAPQGSWTVYAVFEGWHGKMVERAAPGGEGNVIDHFSEKAIQQYLAKFDESFSGKQVASLRAFFNDSYEVDDASGQADWTPQLFDAFKTKRGYDLQDHLPALFDENAGEESIRIRSDFRETISDLLYETFTKEWSEWAKRNKAVIRNQAHGSPSNILDLYAASDIPETEGTDIIKAKMASSAGNVGQRPLISAEAATWLGEHFTTNLADLKQNIDRYFAAGINHVFYHGTTYSPPGEEWPGRLFYAAIHANPRNSLWHDYPTFNAYVERTQSFLQAGKPDNDILLYLPAYDRFAEPHTHLLEHFDGNATSKRSKEKAAVRKVADALQQEGFAFDFISDLQILGLTHSEAGIQCGSLSYQTIVVPETKYIPLSTLGQLQALSAAGATVIFHEALPQHVPGYGDLESRTEKFNTLIGELKAGKATVASDLTSALASAKTPQETLTAVGLSFNRRSHENGKVYFISNWSEDNFDGSIELSASAKTVAIFDPMSGEYGLAEINATGDRTRVKLQLNRGASILLKTFDKKTEGTSWRYHEPNGEPLAVEGKWTLDFNTGGPSLPPAVALDEVDFWTSLEDQSYADFSGTATYSIEFKKPSTSSRDWILDLGQVQESAAVTLNGTYLGTTLGPVHQLHFSSDVLKDQNKLEVRVSNSMGNRIIALEKAGTRWQKFYNINVSARLRENLGPDRVFTTNGWSPFASGLAGPVTLTSTK